MSTEENDTKTPENSAEQPGSTEATPAAPPPAQAAAPAADEADEWEEQPGDDIGNRLPGGAPRDDIGNRSGGGPAARAGGGPVNRPSGGAPVNRGGGAPPATPQTEAAEGAAGAGKKRRRRRRKKGAAAVPGAPAEASAAIESGEGAESEAGDEAADASEATPQGADEKPGAGDNAKKKRRKGKGPNNVARERPAFSIGEEVFGKVAKVTEDAIWVDIVGKAIGLFDLRELYEPMPAPAAPAGEGAPSEAAAAGDAIVSTEAASSNEAATSAEVASEVAAAHEEVTAVPEAAPPGTEAAPSEAEALGASEAAAAETANLDRLNDASPITPPGELPVEGDQFIATVASIGVRGGMLVLSRSPTRLDEARKLLEAAAASGDTVEGFVTGAVKGGLEVDIGGVRAFAPASHVDLRHGANLQALVGRRLDFHVAQYAKKGRDVVVSRKRMLETESRRARSEALRAIEPGSIQRGIVRSVVAWGAFVALPDAGGVEGLIHMTEASHDRGAKLVDLFRQGEEIEVKVLRVDERGKLWLSRRAAMVDPWEAVKQKYAVGSRHKAKVARIQPFGAFIELEPGIDGLIHTADLSLKAIQKPEDVVKVGDEIDVIVASCDPNSHRIGLHPAPPPGEEEEPRQRIQPHKSVKVTVVQVTEPGLVVRVLGVTGRGARGFIPASHTGKERGADLRKDFPIGMKLDVKVLEIDPRRGEAKLSIRALKEDSEKQAYQQYRAGVARDAKFGTFADLMKKSQS